MPVTTVQRLLLGMLQKNLTPIGAKLLFFFLTLLILPVERMAIYLAHALRLFLCLFCVRFGLFKPTYLLNRNLI